jgi:hypothetical protein
MVRSHMCRGSATYTPGLSFYLGNTFGGIGGLQCDIVVAMPHNCLYPIMMGLDILWALTDPEQVYSELT